MWRAFHVTWQATQPSWCWNRLWCGSDVVETETWLKFLDETETSSKTPRPRLEVRDRGSRLQNLCILQKFKKNVVITSDLNFFQISGIFPTCFGCFLPTNRTNKNSLNYRNFDKPFLCNIQSLETWNLRDRDETWNHRDQDRDSQKWVSRLHHCGITDSVSL